MGIRKGRQGGLLPHFARQNSMFFHFIREKFYLLGCLQQKNMFLTPPGKFCPPLQKSLRTPMNKNFEDFQFGVAI
jgi:hypothetical protein